MTKPLRKRRRPEWTGNLTEAALAWLRGEPHSEGWEFFDAPRDLDLAGFYAVHAERLIAEHVEERPGTRPLMWWRFASPEQRKRLGGVGEADASALDYVAGIPAPKCWRWPGQNHYGRLAQVAAVDPLDPPRFESQATFLKRHRLFIAGEAGRLSADAFAPEIATAGRANG